MFGSLYCIDNDILKKLATFDLFEKTILLFETDPENLRVLPTAQYKFQKDWDRVKIGKRSKSSDVCVNYQKTIELAKTLPLINRGNIDQDLFIQLSSFNNDHERCIDQSDALLAAYFFGILTDAGANSSMMLTGDKRLIRALAVADIPNLQNLLHHRLWCLEQLIFRNIECYGFEWVCQQVAPRRDCDQAMKAVFGSGIQSTESNSLDTLDSYIIKLREEANGLLYPFP